MDSRGTTTSGVRQQRGSHAYSDTFSGRSFDRCPVALRRFGHGPGEADHRHRGRLPAFNNLEADGSLVGFDIDIAKALCEEMKVTCEFVTQDWDGIIPALQAKKFDAIIASMSITPERLEKVDFSKKYYNTPPAVAVPKDSTITDVAGLAGKTIGAQSSTTHANYAESIWPTAS